MKQTAVEKLVQEINKLTGLTIQMDEPCIQHAKEIEKEQIINSYDQGEFNQGCNGSAEQYYKETYK